MNTTTQNSSPDATGAKIAFAPVPPDPNLEQVKSGLEVIADREGKYLTFTLAGEEYGIGILKIKEIIGMMAITSPRPPDSSRA